MMLLGWNLLDTVFLLFPVKVVAIIIVFRAVVDALVNLLILFTAYFRPGSDVDFATLDDRVDARRQAERMDDPFDPDGSGAIKFPPARELVSAAQLRLQTVSKAKREKQMPERVEAGVKPDKDLKDTTTFEALQAHLQPESVAKPTAADEYVPSLTEAKPSAAAPVTAEQAPQHSIMGTPAGVNTLSEFLTDDEFVRYVAAQRIIEANELWRLPTGVDKVVAEAAYEKAMDLEPHTLIFKTAYNELRDFVVAKRSQPSYESYHATKQIVESVYIRYKAKIDNKETLK
jgi:hypothetical protein